MPQALTRLASARHLPLAQFQNPQLLLAPDVVAKIQHGFAAFGAQGLALFHQLIEAIRVSLSSAITTVFFLGFIIMLLGLFAVLFLREIPLRTSHTAQPTGRMERKTTLRNWIREDRLTSVCVMLLEPLRGPYLAENERMLRGMVSGRPMHLQLGRHMERICSRVSHLYR